MAQSYDVYFARMLLTRDLVDRDRLQKALATYQKTGLSTGFPQYLEDKGILTADQSRKATEDLEKWFQKRARRAAEKGEDADLPGGTWTADAPAAAPDAPAPAPRVETPSRGQGRPASARVETPSRGQPKPVPARSEAPARPEPAATPEIDLDIPVPAIDTGPAAPAQAQAPRPSSRPSHISSDALPALPSRAKGPASSPEAAPKSPAADAQGTPRAISKRLVKPETAQAAPAAKPAEAPARNELEAPPALKDSPLAAGPQASPKRSTASFRSPAESPATTTPGGAAPRPPSARTVVPSASGRVKAAGEGGAAPPPDDDETSPDKQWALFTKATKDPLAKLVGRRLGRTDITKLLETGEMATVFEGRFGDDERVVTVKVLRKDRVKDQVAMERFTREAKALEKIDHPNIAPVIDAGQAEGVRYITMESGVGEPLSAILEREGRLAPDRAVRIGRATALGLAAAHRAGIVHRDVRPANLLIENDGTVKIIGFGMARDVAVHGRLTATGQITGHPSYVAPEIAGGENVSGKADVYSLGVVLYLALSGRLPFASRSVVKLVGLHLNAPVPPLLHHAPHLPPRVATLVEGLLTKDPTSRPEAMAIANALAAKDLLEGGSADASKALPVVRDAEEDLRRALATDEHGLSEDGTDSIGGPACAACELPLGDGEHELHGNKICAKCWEKVEALDLCAACFHEVTTHEATGAESAVFAGHIYCKACTARVVLPCAMCTKPAGLKDLASGNVKQKGDKLIHKGCMAGGGG